MGLRTLFSKPAKPLLVVDCAALIDAGGNRGKIPPRNQLQTLRRLADFSRQEKLEVVAVMGGNPLNKAPAGKKFEGMVVLYSPPGSNHAQFVAQTVRAKGSKALLVSAGPATEKLVGNRAGKLRISTFRKAFEGLGDMGDPDRSGGGRPNRPPRRRGPPPGNEPQDQSGPPEQEDRTERRPRETSQSDAINELIDLVD